MKYNSSLSYIISQIIDIPTNHYLTGLETNKKQGREGGKYKEYYFNYNIPCHHLPWKSDSCLAFSTFKYDFLMATIKFLTVNIKR